MERTGKLPSQLNYAALLASEERYRRASIVRLLLLPEVPGADLLEVSNFVQNAEGSGLRAVSRAAGGRR